MAGVMKALIRTKGLNTKASRGLHERLLVPTPPSKGCETLVWHEYEPSRVRAVARGYEYAEKCVVAIRPGRVRNTEIQ